MKIVKNKVVLLRSDLNDGLVTKNINNITEQVLENTNRIDAAITSIFNLLHNNNRIILTSHLSDDKQTLLPIANYIKKHFAPGEFVFLETLDREEIYNFIKNNFHQNDNLKIILLENLRSFPIGLEEKKDEIFASWLASLAEYFIFDAFSVAHRDHTSVMSIAKYLPHSLGEIATKEYKNLAHLLNDKKDLFVILGGAKISTKLPLIKSLLQNNSTIFVGGAMANTLLYLKGYDIKSSLIEKEIFIEKEILNHKNLILLTDIKNDYIWDKDKIVDLNNMSVHKICDQNLSKYTDIFWNGPLGIFESGYNKGTKAVIKELNKKEYKNKTIIGGGDTLAAISNWEKEEHKSFEIKYKSLSGGAALTFLEQGKLSGIDINNG